MSGNEYTCVVCPNGCLIEVSDVGEISGHKCPRGVTWVEQEMENPMRTIASNILVSGGDFINASVRTNRPVPLTEVTRLMEKIRATTVEAPVKIGTVLFDKPLGLDTEIIFTRSVNKLITHENIF